MATDPILQGLTDKPDFKNTTDELHFHLVRAEYHAQRAYELLFKPEGPKRSLWFRMLVGRAQSILMSCWTTELRKNKWPS
jgi:hypothetical protein